MINKKNYFGVILFVALSLQAMETIIPESPSGPVVLSLKPSLKKVSALPGEKKTVQFEREKLLVQEYAFYLHGPEYDYLGEDEEKRAALAEIHALREVNKAEYHKELRDMNAVSESLLSVQERRARRLAELREQHDQECRTAALMNLRAEHAAEALRAKKEDAQRRDQLERIGLTTFIGLGVFGVYWIFGRK